MPRPCQTRCRQHARIVLQRQFASELTLSIQNSIGSKRGSAYVFTEQKGSGQADYYEYTQDYERQIPFCSPEGELQLDGP